MKLSIGKMRVLVIVVFLVFLSGGSAVAQIWDAGGGDKNWTTDANWSGDVKPANPAVSTVAFTNNGVGTTNLMDVSWVLGSGLTMNSTIGGTNTIDLCGNTLTISNGTLACTKGIIAFTNGTLRIGAPSAATILNIASAAINTLPTRVDVCSDFTLNFSTNDLNVGCSGGGGNGNGGSYGTFDLRSGITTQTVFSCKTLTIGYAQYPYWNNWNAGRMYLNDKNGVLQKFAVSNLYFYKGDLTLNSGCAVEIGASSNRGVLWISRTGDDWLSNQAVVLTPTGDFTAYLTDMTIGYGWGTSGNGSGSTCAGTLDLSNAVIKTFDVSGTAKIGVNNGIGNVYLGAGSTYFDSLLVGVTPVRAATLKLYKGAQLTVGNGISDTFTVIATYGKIVLDFSNPATRLAVYGNYAAGTGPAANITNYMADGRIAVTNDGGKAGVVYDGTYSYVTMAPVVTTDGGVTNLTSTSGTLNGMLISTGTAPASVWFYWGPTDGGTTKGNWSNAVSIGAMSTGTLFSANVTGLLAGQTNYYRSYASNTAADAWALSTVSFNALSQPGINNGSGASATTNKALLVGTLTAGSRAYVTVYWGAANGDTTPSSWGNSNSMGLLNEGTFSTYATGLTAGLTYYYRCYASNEVGVAWASATSNFVAQEASGAGQIWDGGGGTVNGWLYGQNWVGDVRPGRPATSVITFNDTDIGNPHKMDSDWTLNAGMTVASPADGTHTMDLGSNTLTVAGGVITVSQGNLVLSNGTVGLPSTPASLTIAYGGSGYSTKIAASDSIVLNLGNVEVGYGTGAGLGGYNNGGTYGLFDLRNATTTQTVFSCRALTIGNCSFPYWDHWCGGKVYLNDKNGLLQKFAVSNLNFYKGEIYLNSGCAVEIGTPSIRGGLWISRTGDDSLGNTPVVFAPNGNFTAYLTNMVIGYGWGTAGNGSANTCAGTLDLTNAVIQAFDISGTACIGTNNGIGNVYLGAGSTYFDSLLVGVTPVRAATLKLCKGGTLTVGNGNSDTFYVVPTYGKIELDFANPYTQLKVYGNYASSGPATNINTYIADGRIVITNGTAGFEVGYNGIYSYVRPLRNTGTMILIE